MACLISTERKSTFCLHTQYIWCVCLGLAIDVRPVLMLMPFYLYRWADRIDSWNDTGTSRYSRAAWVSAKLCLETKWAETCDLPWGWEWAWAWVWAWAWDDLDLMTETIALATHQWAWVQWALPWVHLEEEAGGAEMWKVGADFWCRKK